MNIKKLQLFTTKETKSISADDCKDCHIRPAEYLDSWWKYHIAEAIKRGEITITLKVEE